MKKIKITSFLCILVMLLSLTACECKHKKLETVPAKTATCTEKGLTEGKKCGKCGEILTAQTEIPAEHKYENGKCTVCNQEGGYEYDKLNKKEKALFNALKQNIESFYDPSSVKLVKIEEEFWNGKAYKIRLSATNKSGNSAQREYFLVVENGTYTDNMVNEYSTAHRNNTGFNDKDYEIYLFSGELGDIEYLINDYDNIYIGYKNFTSFVWSLCKFQDSYDTPKDVTVGNINNALEEYKKVLGY